MASPFSIRPIISLKIFRPGSFAEYDSSNRPTIFSSSFLATDSSSLFCESIESTCRSSCSDDFLA
ncbi:MAG: hypothetical protein A2626_02050 [Candidatus Nealsonbacteria bacterium RIFCSPHIGHO2_01_FULL_38_55]|uniref:Uncharacterized protein n=1 Tax=Candidatus Nealsonbacteria bacterium RIFCSPHIGHO2_01_FULL_38_55 TaxID=1801664 RepID=A0A1G2E3L4_9BACT|nr:MAG: hypothetical protein A2626_02050 [Candidatus Nealsonbacteria bacterium RIFCSPHIGHO2_01_FULL_38_55]OGZ24026.1 MAG: hypothetical protein A2981_00885 [Candidatus Nealsonbacteria bacterium RIFCSPLOWO2_01_FULL_38_120]OGZ25471.1 MAG: hypothetical protein A3I85_02260 [Candidatus Nealsonbacteria bacterium RIFCSPLOWO2_02_FULL_38_63]